MYRYLPAEKNAITAELYISPEFTRAVAGHCRRVMYEGGISKMYGDTNSANFIGLEGSSDSGIELLYCYGNDNDNDSNKKLNGSNQCSITARMSRAV